MRRWTRYLLTLLLIGVGLFTLLPVQAAVITVNTVSDAADANINDDLCDIDLNVPDLQCSLRAAIQNAERLPDVDAISFSVVGVIQLGSTLPAITQDVIITAPGAQVLTIRRRAGADLFGLISHTSGQLLLQGVTLSNGAATNGGAINSAGRLFVANIEFTSNTASASGGAIYSTGELDIRSSVINGNNAANGGGVYADGTTVIIASTFYGNWASSGGSINATALTLYDSTVSGSSADTGGAITVRGESTLANSTISSNSADQIGGGVYVNGQFTSTVTLRNTTIARNTAASGAGVGAPGTGQSLIISLFNALLVENLPGGNCGTTITSGGSNLSSDLSCTGLTAAGDSQNVAANIGGLANNGGDVLTHALLPGSPAIDGGSASLLALDVFDRNGDGIVNQLIPFDARGVDNGIPYQRLSGVAPDIGAYEVQQTPISATNTAVIIVVTAVPSSTPTITGTPPTATSTATATITGTPPTATATSTPPTPTSTGTLPTPTNTLDPNITPTVTNTTDPNATPTNTTVGVATATPTTIPLTATETTIPFESATPSPTVTGSASPTLETPTATATLASDLTPTETATTDPNITPSATETTDPNITPSATATTDPNITPSATATTDPNITPSATATTAPPAVCVQVSRTNLGFGVTESGASEGYNVRLSAPPAAGETVTVFPFGFDAAQITVSPVSRQFNNSNWNTGRSFTVTAVNDALDEIDPLFTTIFHSTDSSNNASVWQGAGACSGISVGVHDND